MKQYTITEKDFLLANRRTSHMEEIECHDKKKSLGAYDRNRMESSNNEQLVNELIRTLELKNVQWQEGPLSCWDSFEGKGNHYLFLECIIYDKESKPAFEIVAKLKGHFVDEYDNIVHQLDSFAVSRIECSEKQRFLDEYDQPAYEDVVLKSKHLELTEAQYHIAADLLRESGVGGLCVPGIVATDGRDVIQPFVRERYIKSDSSKNFSSLKDTEDKKKEWNELLSKAMQTKSK